MSGLEMRYFILKPKGTNKHAEASRAGMLAYANIIESEIPELASEIRQWVEREGK